MATTDWTVHLEAAGEPGAVGDDALDHLHALLHEHGGSVTSVDDGSRYGVTFSMRGYHAAIYAAERAVHVFRTAAREAGLPELPIVRIDVLTFDEHDAEPTNRPKLVGVAEISMLLGVTRPRAAAVATSPGFPEPLAILKSGPIWTRASLNTFLESWPRRMVGKSGGSKDRASDESSELGIAVS